MSNRQSLLQNKKWKKKIFSVRISGSKTNIKILIKRSMALPLTWLYREFCVEKEDFFEVIETTCGQEANFIEESGSSSPEPVSNTL